MPLRLNASDADFSAQLAALLAARAGSQQEVAEPVRAIIADVRARGDAALIDYTAQFDQLTLAAPMRITSEQKKRAQADCPPEVKAALASVAERLADYHAKQKPQDFYYTDSTGTGLGWRWGAMDAVGLYVPGGRASYPSSVLHNAMPARAAGCERLVMVVPTPGGEINPAILVAAELAGIDEIYPIGGAQAIAALSYGTQSIQPVDMVVGPGNAYVAEAKRQLFGQVGIDMIAGPSEICIIADAGNNPDWIAADLLSQSEHDPLAQSILITDDAAFAERVAQAVDHTLATLTREPIARAAWNEYGAIILSPSLHEAARIANRLAPEHLELAVADPHGLSQHIRHAGAIFLGRYTPEAIGDYIAGPSHVLPTTQTARFASGLSVYHFMKKTSLIACSAESLQQIGPAAATLADCEGLGAHALSIRARLKN